MSRTGFEHQSRASIRYVVVSATRTRAGFLDLSFGICASSMCRPQFRGTVSRKSKCPRERSNETMRSVQTCRPSFSTWSSREPYSSASAASFSNSFLSSGQVRISQSPNGSLESFCRIKENQILHFLTGSLAVRCQSQSRSPPRGGIWKRVSSESSGRHREKSHPKEDSPILRVFSRTLQVDPGQIGHGSGSDWRTFAFTANRSRPGGTDQGFRKNAPTQNVYAPLREG